MFKKSFLVAATAALIAPAFAAEWISDFDVAKAQAAKEGKAILADFTGSDWCGWCIRLRQAVLDTPAFENYAKDKFVLAEIDVPNAPKISKELKEKNMKLCEQYRIEGFPTLLVMDAKGQVMGGFSGGRTSLKEVQSPLDKGLENLSLRQQAATQQGAEKLQTLIRIYNNYPEQLRFHAADIRDEILKLDTANTSGLQDEFKAKQQMERFQTELISATSEAQAIAMLERMKTEALPPNQGTILMQLFNLKAKNANTVADIMEAKKILLQAAETAPAHKKAAIKAAAEKQFADPEALLKQIKAYRNSSK